MSQPGLPVDDASRQVAEAYQRYFVPAIGAPVAEDLIAAAALRAGERVLDVACGTGVVTRLAAQRVGAQGSVAGLDLDPAMLAVARSVSPPELDIDWHQAPAEAMPLPDQAFDVVLCQMGLQFFSDKAAALREMRRVLRPGGRLLFNLPGPEPAPLAAMAEALARIAGPQAGAFVRVVFSLHDERELRELTRGAGFSAIDVQSAGKALHLPAPRDFLWQYLGSTPLAALTAQMSDGQRQQLEREVVTAWQPFTADGGTAMTVRMTTVSAA